jgi:hypothetical protein
MNPAQVLAQEILGGHTDTSDHSCSSCTTGGTPDGWRDWPCVAVRLAWLVLGVTRYQVTQENNSFWVGRDPMTGKAVYSLLEPGQYSEDEVDRFIKDEQQKFSASLVRAASASLACTRRAR